MHSVVCLAAAKTTNADAATATFFCPTAGTIKRTMEENNTERSSFLAHVYTLQQTGSGMSEFRRGAAHCGSTEGDGALTGSLGARSSPASQVICPLKCD